MNYETIINNIAEKNKLIKVNEKITLTNYQIEVLEKYQIPYSTCNSINEIIFYIEDILNEDSNDCEDLENISTTLAEVDYYYNYKKWNKSLKIAMKF